MQPIAVSILLGGGTHEQRTHITHSIPVKISTPTITIDVKRCVRIASPAMKRKETLRPLKYAENARHITEEDPVFVPSGLGTLHARILLDCFQAHTDMCIERARCRPHFHIWRRARKRASIARST